MKLSEKVLDAMSSIDEKLLKESEEYTGKRKAFDLRILVMAAAVLLFAIIILPKSSLMLESQNAAANAADEAVEYGEIPQEIENNNKGTAEEDTVACTEEEERNMITDALREALKSEGEITIAASALEDDEPVSTEILESLCRELSDYGYDAFTEDGNIIFTVNASAFDPETLPDRYDWILDLYN